MGPITKSLILLLVKLGKRVQSLVRDVGNVYSTIAAKDLLIFMLLISFNSPSVFNASRPTNCAR